MSLPSEMSEFRKESNSSSIFSVTSGVESSEPLLSGFFFLDSTLPLSLSSTASLAWETEAKPTGSEPGCFRGARFRGRFDIDRGGKSPRLDLPRGGRSARKELDFWGTGSDDCFSSGVFLFLDSSSSSPLLLLGSGVAGSSISEAGGDVWQSEMVDGVGDSDFKTETFDNQWDQIQVKCFTFESRIISESRGAWDKSHLVNKLTIFTNVTSGSVNSVSPSAEQSLVLSLYCTSRPMLVSGSKTAKLKSRSKNWRNSLWKIHVKNVMVNILELTSQGLPPDVHWYLREKQPVWDS